MVSERVPQAVGPNSTAQFDELQRGQESAPTVEMLERLTPSHHGERREIPDPGERPGAIRLDEEAGDAEADAPDRETQGEGGHGRPE